MNRVIKFRAYCEEDKVMIYDLNSPHLIHGELKDDLYILMQFTGLLDRNSVEIFEGDIVTKNEYPFIDGNVKPYIAFIIWDAPCFYFELKLLDKKRRGISDGIIQILEDSENFEIIGNLYEHPHLLESEPT